MGVVERQLTLQHQWKFLEIFYRISRKEKRTRKMTHKTVFVFSFCVLFFVFHVESKPQFNLGALFGNAVSSTFNTAFGRDCRGRPQGDYFFGCQCVGPFSVGREEALAYLPQQQPGCWWRLPSMLSWISWLKTNAFVYKHEQSIALKRC